MAYHINYACVSHIGNVRKNNEDNFWCEGECLPAENQGTERVKSGKAKVTSRPVFGVFDGMGGESCGEIAAHLSADVCGKWQAGHKKFLTRDPENFWMQLCQEMNRAVCAYARENKIRTMGSTAAMLAFDQEAAYACNLGDSSIYELQDGELKKISEDHVLKRNLFGKAPLLQYVGIPENRMALEPSRSKLELREGTRYLICSDGVTDMLTEPELRNLMAAPKEVKEIVEEICSRSLNEGGRDNITIILCEVTEEKRNWLANWFEKYRKELQRVKHNEKQYEGIGF